MSDAGSSQPHAPREGLLLPFLVPVGALVFIGLVLFGFSRVLLAVTPNAATAVAIVSASSVLGIAAFVATRRRVTERSMASLVGAVAGVAMFAGGVAILAFPVAKEGGEGVTVTLAAPVGASGKGFDPTTLSVPVDKAFTIEFDNQDVGVTHNVQIFDGGDATAPLVFSGDPTTGPLAAPFPYPIDPLKPGTYFFDCKFHPTTMTGTIEAAAGGGGGGGPTSEIAATNLQFSTATVRLPADSPATLTFDNRDTALHDFAIYEDDTAAKTLFTSEDVPPGSSVPMSIPPLPAGNYYFRCNYHPTTMNGTVIVEAAGPPPSPGAGGSDGAGGSASASPPPGGG
jgi:plastocyanin